MKPALPLAVSLIAWIPQNAQFNARTDVVLVPVSVLKGREPVRDLTAADFELTDNGVNRTGFFGGLIP